MNDVPKGQIRIRTYRGGRITLETAGKPETTVVLSDRNDGDWYDWVRMPDDNGKMLGFYGLLLWLDGESVQDIPFAEVRRESRAALAEVAANAPVVRRIA